MDRASGTIGIPLLGQVMAGHIATSKSTTWRTPQNIIEAVKSFYGGVIALDPCASDDPSHHFAVNNLTASDNGLKSKWYPGTYCNPPYGRGISDWIKKAYFEQDNGNASIMLIPASVDTKIWQDIILPRGLPVCFVRGRIKFDGDTSGPAPMACAMVCFSRADYVHYRFRESFSKFGHCT